MTSTSIPQQLIHSTTKNHFKKITLNTSTMKSQSNPKKYPRNTSKSLPKFKKSQRPQSSRSQVPSGAAKESTFLSKLKNPKLIKKYSKNKTTKSPWFHSSSPQSGN
jgi:hypothetical protein